MKPAWDALAATFEGSDKVLIADVDCTGVGEPLCARFEVEGFPTIKYFNPPDDEGEDYEGERDEESLLAFANSALGPGCAPGQLEYCSDSEREELDQTLAMPEEARNKELEQMQHTLALKVERLEPACLDNRT